jgi:hypothetical protein
MPPSLASRECSSSLRIFFLLHLLPQHFYFALMKCELHLPHPFFSQDIHKTYVRSFHRQDTLSHYLCLFLFLWLEEEWFYWHIVFLVSFLLSLGEYEVSSLHPWVFMLYLGQLLCLCSDFYHFPFDFAFGLIFLQPLEKYDKNIPHF